MVLTSEQIRAIANSIGDGGIFMDSLKNDLIDHMCCAIESRMSDGIPFEIAFSEAMKDLAPAGLNEIQTQTILLLHPKMLIMKKIMYLLGLGTTISMTMGLMFKLLHMPGGEQLFNYGFLIFALVFLPMVAIKKFAQKEKRPMYEKIKTVLGFISTIGVGCAILLKIATDYETSSIILLISVSIFCFGFLPFLFYDLYKESLGDPEKQNNLEDQLL
jgi:hypothetical protein